MAAELTAPNARQFRQVGSSKMLPRAAAASPAVPMWPALAVTYAAMMPPEVGFYAGSLWLGFYRITLVALIPVVVFYLIKRRYHVHWIDGVMLFLTLWLPISFSVNYDLNTGLEAGGSQLFDMFFAYLVGRIFMLELDRFKAFLKGLLPGLAVVGFLVMAESVSGTLFVRPTAVAIFGSTSENAAILNIEYRLGLLRAFGPFAHPIHAGVFLASFLPLYLCFFKKSSTRVMGVITSFFCIFTLSSAAVLGLVLSGILMLLDRLLKYSREFNWNSALAGGAILMTIAHFASKNGIISVIYRYLTFNPTTGFYRTIIWQYASANVWANPWFGIGYEEYIRPAWMTQGSIDAHYLAMAVSYGFPPAFCYFIVTVAVIVILGRQASRLDGVAARNVFAGMAICLAMLLVVLFTVTLWGSLLSWFNLMLGMFLSISISANGKMLRR